MTRAQTAEVERSLSHQFTDASLLISALTHRSAGKDNYERLEFLGDGILNALIGESLFRQCQNAAEGDLSRLRASLVCESTLAEIARELGLSEHIRVGAGESGSHRRNSVMSDVLEALIAAVYLDAGFDTVSHLVQRLFASRLSNLPDAESLKDPKTRLQEYLQSRDRPLPEYSVLNSSGPAHRRVFEVACSLQEGGPITTAQGSSRRRAEQSAAEAMLAQINDD